MCDTIVVVHPDGVLFAKNSDRDANEAQFLEWSEAQSYSQGTMLDCAYLQIPQVEHTNAILISRPYWMTGAEMGTNEHGVTIGNEGVFTKEPYAKTGLTGMDLIRLALERASTAKDAMEVIIDLLETYGQGGGCGHEDRSFTYHNSFIIADPTTAYVLETAGKKWASEHVTSGVRTISNGLTIPHFAAEHADRLRGRVAGCQLRTSITTTSADGATTVAQIAKTLRSHGEATWPDYGLLTGTLDMPCMHGGGLLAGSITAASWIGDLRPGQTQHWATATSSPCLGVFKPISLSSPLDLGREPTDQPDSESLWWRHERLSRRAMTDPERLVTFLHERDEVEAQWFSSPPASSKAFDQADILLRKWTDEVEQAGSVTDTRPWQMRRYWGKRNAGLADTHD